jgi:hypothetical protein
VSVGTNSTDFDNIIADTALIALDATTESFMMEVGGIFHLAVGGSETITFNVDTAETGGALTVDVDLIGYLV